MRSGGSAFGSLGSRAMLGATRGFTAVVLLVLPTAMAFFSGGYFAGPRLAAGVAVWLLALVGFWLAPAPLPRQRPGQLAVVGIAALALIVGLSIAWAPLRGVAQSDLQRLLLYLGAFLAATTLLRGDSGLRLAEPLLALGALIVTGYALAARLLPGLVEEAASASAAGRLEQPLTYWNASGMLAAVGLILCLRVAADAARQGWMRSAAIAASLPLGLGVYLTFSRGALLGVAVGAILLIVFSRERRQLRVLAVGIGGAVLVSAVAALLPAVLTLQGPLPTREREGLVLLVVLIAAMVAAVLAARWLSSRPDGAPLSAPRALAASLVAVMLIGFVAVAAGDGSSRGQPRFGADTRRLTSFESNRYAYWKVAGKMFIDQPLAGDGSGSFRVVWRQQRKIADPALDAHSLYFETGAELGIIGLLALALFFCGVGWAGRNLLRERRGEAVGALAALGALAVHAGLDWDWEMPALALIGLLLAGAVVAANEEIGSAARSEG